MSRIVVMGDSMTMARPHLSGAERIPIDSVYGELLRVRYEGAHKVDIAFVNSMDSENAVANFYPMVALREPDVVILHLGINDCAPRLFRKGNRHLFLKPWFRRISRDRVMRLLYRHRYRVTKWRRMVYVKPDRFERNMRELRDKVRMYSPEARVYALSIVEVAGWLAERSYGYIANIRLYNDILKRVFEDEFIDVNGLMPESEFLLSDGYHFTVAAHRAVADVIAQRLEESQAV